MRAKEFIIESVTFSVGKLTDENGEKHFSDPWQKKVTGKCWACDGTGIEKYSDEGGNEPYPCGLCKGTKEITDWESDAPEMNVSNGNASEILLMLGFKDEEIDSAGIIDKSKLPEIMRRLIKLKNGDISQHTAPWSDNNDTTRKMQAYKDADGMDKIGYNEPHIMGGQRTYEQVSRYIDKLIKMIQFAQQNDATIGWG